jgi:hypothetical protein
MTYLAEAAGYILFAMQHDCVPSFHIHYPSKSEFIWDDYFMPLDKNDHIIVDCPPSSFPSIDGPTFGSVYNIKEIQVWGKIYNCFFVFNDDTNSYLNSLIDELKPFKERKRILGCSIRGTDYITLRPAGHPVQPNFNKILKKIKRIFIQYEIEYIYITTDEERYINKLKEVYGDKVLAVNRKYYDRFNDNSVIMTHVTQIEFERDNDYYLRGLEYLASVVLLARCSALIGGNCGATSAAVFMNNLKYEYCYVFNMGTYR